MIQRDSYIAPDFSASLFQNSPNATTSLVTQDGVAPKNYHALSIYPTYFKIGGRWILAVESRMDAVAVVEGDEIRIVEFRNLKAGDRVVLGRTEDASEGIFMYTEGFQTTLAESDRFSFRTGRSRETAFSKDYDELYDLMRYERKAGRIVWVLGPSISYDERTREHFSALVREGYVSAVITGNSTAVVDLALGLPKEDLPHREEHAYIDSEAEYHTVRRIRELGGIEAAIQKGAVRNGIMKSLVEHKVPYVLAGSIRDRYNLLEVIDNVYEAQDAMRAHTRQATMLICLSSVLNTIATGNMTPSYTVQNGIVRKVHIYTIDLQEFSVNKLSDRGTLEVKTLVTNIHDFLAIVATALLPK